MSVAGQEHSQDTSRPESGKEGKRVFLKSTGTASQSASRNGRLVSDPAEGVQTLLKLPWPLSVMSNNHLCCPRPCCFQQSQTWLPCAVWIHVSLRATCLLPGTSGQAHAGGLGRMKLFHPQTHTLPAHKDPTSRANLYIHSFVSPILSRM